MLTMQVDARTHVDGMGCNITHAYMSSNVCDLLLSEHGQTEHWARNCAHMHALGLPIRIGPIHISHVLHT